MSRRRQRNIYSKKKRKLNKKKIIILVCFIGLFLFGINKVTKGVGSIFEALTAKGASAQEAQSDQKQYDLEDEQSKVEKKYTVTIDAGHGGNDGGTANTDKSTVEKGLALSISKKVANKLSKQKDIEVIMTRTDDSYISLADRAKIANDHDSDVLVSIHLNAEAGGTTATGVETYHKRGATDNSVVLADAIQSTIISHVDARDRGVKEDIYEVLLRAEMPAVLVECGFLTNASEEEKLKDDAYQEQLAEGIAQGILSYLDKTEAQ